MTQVNKKGLLIWHGNESTHLCGLLVLSLSQWKFFLYHSRVCTWGQGGFFSILKFTCLKIIIKVRVTDHMAGRRLPSVLLPRLCLLPHPVPALFICWINCWLLHCHSKHLHHPGRLFDNCKIIHLYKVKQLYDFISTHFSHSGNWALIQGYKTYHDTIWATRNQR